MVHWGIIGAGDVVRRKSGRAFQNISGSECLALTRRNQDEAKSIADFLNVPRIYPDVEQLLADSNINAVYIATPPSSHADLAIRALSAGKDVYLEKPAAINAAQAWQIAEAVKTSGRKLSVAHYRRALPAFEKVGELLRLGEVGSVRFVRIRILQPSRSDLIAETGENWRINPALSGGGLFHDLAPHQLDLMLHWFGDVSSVQGIALNLAGDSPADDYVSGNVLFESGVVLSGLWSFCIDSSLAPEDLCEVFGAKGRLSFSFFGDRVLLEKEENQEVINFEQVPVIQQPMIERVVRYFSGSAENPCSIEEAISTLQVMDQMTGK